MGREEANSVLSKSIIKQQDVFGSDLFDWQRGEGTMELNTSRAHPLLSTVLQLQLICAFHGLWIILQLLGGLFICESHPCPLPIGFKFCVISVSCF